MAGEPDARPQGGTDVTPGLIYVTGGARSGKSRFAEGLASRAGEPVTYLATAQAFDAEMTERIGRHRHDRPADWHTLEEPLERLCCLNRAGVG